MLTNNRLQLMAHMRHHHDALRRHESSMVNGHSSHLNVRDRWSWSHCRHRLWCSYCHNRSGDNRWTWLSWLRGSRNGHWWWCHSRGLHWWCSCFHWLGNLRPFINLWLRLWSNPLLGLILHKTLWFVNLSYLFLNTDICSGSSCCLFHTPRVTIPNDLRTN